MNRISSETAARILGVTVDAKVAEINKAWRQIARTCHPDLHPGDKEAEKKFRLLNAAYTVLSELNEGIRRMRGLEEDIIENEFDNWIKRLDPNKQKRIKETIAKLEEEDDSY